MPLQTRPWTLWIVTAVRALLALMALPVGLMMLRTPHADVLGIPVAWLEATVFGSFLVPGLFLFGLLGIGSLCAIYGLLARPGWAWPQRMNPFQNLRWEWTFAAGIGLAAVVWITVQYISLRVYFWLQPIVFGMGLAIVLLMCLPSMRRYYSMGPSPAALPANQARGTH